MGVLWGGKTCGNRVGKAWEIWAEGVEGKGITSEEGSYSWVGPFCIVSDSSDATITAIRPSLDSDAAFLKVHTDTKFQTGDKVSVLINAGNGASFTQREVATVG